LAAGFGKVVFVIRHDMAELFRRTVGSRYEGTVEVAYAFQELEPLPGGRVSPPGRTKPWGTGHAVLAASSVVREPFAVINADDYYGPVGFAALAAFLATAEPGHYAMVGYRLDRTLSENGSVSRGICTVEGQGRLVGHHRKDGHRPGISPGGSSPRKSSRDVHGRGIGLDEFLGLHARSFQPSGAPLRGIPGGEGKRSQGRVLSPCGRQSADRLRGRPR